MGKYFANNENLSNNVDITIKSVIQKNELKGNRLTLGSGAGATKRCKRLITKTVPADGRWAQVVYQKGRHSMSRVEFHTKLKGIYTNTMGDCKALVIMYSQNGGDSFSNGSLVHIHGGVIPKHSHKDLGDFLVTDMVVNNCWAIWNSDQENGSVDRHTTEFLNYIDIPANQRATYYYKSGSFGVCADGRFGETDQRLSARQPRTQDIPNIATKFCYNKWK